MSRAIRAIRVQSIEHLLLLIGGCIEEARRLRWHWRRRRRWRHHPAAGQTGRHAESVAVPAVMAERSCAGLSVAAGYDMADAETTPWQTGKVSVLEGKIFGLGNVIDAVGVLLVEFLAVPLVT